MKFPLIYLLIIFSNISIVLAQTGTGIDHTQISDSLRKAGMEAAAIGNPLLRQISVSTDVISRGNVHNDFNGTRLFDAKVSQFRTASLFNVPVKHWGKNSVSLSLLTLQQITNFSDVQSIHPELTQHDLNFQKVTVGLTASFSRADRLFGVPVYYTASVSGTSDDVTFIKKMSYLAGAVFALKQTSNSRIMLGGVINIDPSLNLPFIPVISYWHRFDDGLELNFNMPTQTGIRKQFSNRFCGSLGTSITGSIAFFNNNQSGIPRDVNYTTLELKTGPGLEYRAYKKLILGINGGVLSNLQSRAFERGGKSSDYFSQNKFGNAGYVNFTISVLPFL